MIDARHLDLIHAELDGELDAAGRAELARCMAASAELAQWHRDLTQLTASLDGLERAAPPASLAADIRAALPPAVAQPSRLSVVRGGLSQSVRRAVPGGWPGGWPVWAMAASLTGLVLAGSMLLHVDSVLLSDNSQLAGTLLKAHTPPGQLDSVALDFADLHGRATTYQAARGVNLDVAVNHRAPVEIMVSYAGGELRLDHLPKATGYQHFTVALPGPAVGTAPVHLRFMVNGQALGAVSLKGAAHLSPAPDAR